MRFDLILKLILIWRLLQTGTLPTNDAEQVVLTLMALAATYLAPSELHSDPACDMSLSTLQSLILDGHRPMTLVHNLCGASCPKNAK